MKLFDFEQIYPIINSSIPAHYHCWALFRNGTFLVLDRMPSMDKDFRTWVISFMDELNSLNIKVFTYDSDIIQVPQTGGWIVTNFKGIYTYVDPKEFTDSNPSELAISVMASQKLLEDCRTVDIIHMESQRMSQKSVL